MSAWAIALTKPNGEELAERSMRQAGYRVYLPRYRKLLQPHGGQRRSASAMRPLIPGYLFVQDWRGWPVTVILSGLSGMMPSPRLGGVARLSDADIALMMEREHACAHDQVRFPPGSQPVIRDDVEVGETVGFEMAGALLRGTLEAMSADGRALVKAMIFGRETQLGMDQDALQVVAQSA